MLEVSALKNKCKEKLAKEIQYMICQSVAPLSQFLQIMLHPYQIENVVNIIEGVKNNVDLAVLLKRADPLGDFPELKNIRTVEGDDYAQLFQTVLIDLPIGIYFREFMEELLLSDPNKDIGNIPILMKDYKPEKIKNLLRKNWLMEFNQFIQKNTNGLTQEVMEDILKFEADCMTMQIIYNSIGNKELGSIKGREGDRRKYITNLGT